MRAKLARIKNPKYINAKLVCFMLHNKKIML